MLDEPTSNIPSETSQTPVKAVRRRRATSRPADAPTDATAAEALTDTATAATGGDSTPEAAAAAATGKAVTAGSDG
ncbi:MAG: hypothetical protein JWN08_997, partial [Frankiales bacterium]|nr:hypothetical protein [Frankiales bacterium]